ncbi:MAG TPA: endonuclease domain-containing protein [Anaerolineae bacterium]|nr:endonuclease domain-containing protein [Anaerolineae bacterium]
MSRQAKPSQKRWRASVEMQTRARELRRDMTPAEKGLWARIRDGQLNGMHFRKQHAVGRFILDFYCAKAKLVIEVDGDSHADQVEYDAERTRWLNEQKHYCVIRFTNRDVLSNIDAVLEQILQALSPSHQPTN